MPPRHRPTRSIPASSPRAGITAAIVATLLGSPLATASPWCPADLDDDGVVDSTDLSSLLSQWGRCPSGGCPADLDEDGRVDGIDLTLLLAAWGACPPPPATILVGTVVLSDGTPVAGASIITDLGGGATSGKEGAFELSLALPIGATSVTLSASATIGSASYAGDLLVSDVAVGATNEVGAIILEPQFSCPGGFAWRPTFSPLGLNYWVDALAVFDDGSGPALFVGGRFTSAGGVPANCIAKWNGTTWSALGSGTNLDVRALEVFDDGSGPKLYVGGIFSTAGGVNIGYGIARWNGSTWSKVGSGFNGAVNALAVFDSGSGPALHAGGDFILSGSTAVRRVARWNGSSWSPLGSGVGSCPSCGDEGVRTLAVHDDGSGPALFVGGRFASAGGVNIGYGIARWNGSTWSAVGGGVSDAVSALVVHDDGAGPALYAGGNFLNAGGVPVNKLARWNGQAWSAVGFPTSFLSVFSLASFDDGTGPALYAGGTSFLWKWNGGSWSPFGGGLGSPSGGTVEVYTLRGFEFGGTRSLFVGGQFTTSGGILSPNLAEWGCSGP